MFCEKANGLELKKLDELNSSMLKMMKGENLSRDEKLLLGDAISLEGVSKLPIRVKCALLVYETWSEVKKKLMNR